MSIEKIEIDEIKVFNQKINEIDLKIQQLKEEYKQTKKERKEFEAKLFLAKLEKGYDRF